MNSSNQNINFHLGLLHFVHLLTIVDGVIDERERLAIKNIIREEDIPATVVADFEKSVAGKTEKDVYQDGLAFLNQCSDDEKKCVFVHLYRLTEVDDKVHVKEVRLLLYSIKASNIDFEDVELIARLTKATNHLVVSSKHQSAA